MAGLDRIADHQGAGRFDQPPEKGVVDGLQHDRAAARRALLAAVAEGRLPHAQHGLVQVGRLVDDDRVLAAHLADDLLHERLAFGRRLAGGAEDAQPDLLRAGEGDQRHARVANQRSPTSRPAPGRKWSTSGGTPAEPEDLAHRRAMRRVWLDGLTMAVLPATRAAAVMPVQMARGKFHGLMTAATPRGWYHWWLSSPTNRPSRRGWNRATAYRA